MPELADTWQRFLDEIFTPFREGVGEATANLVAWTADMLRSQFDVPVSTEIAELVLVGAGCFLTVLVLAFFVPDRNIAPHRRRKRRRKAPVMSSGSGDTDTPPAKQKGRGEPTLTQESDTQKPAKRKNAKRKSAKRKSAKRKTAKPKAAKPEAAKPKTAKKKSAKAKAKSGASRRAASREAQLAAIEKDMLRIKGDFEAGKISGDEYLTASRALYERAQNLT